MSHDDDVDHRSCVRQRLNWLPRCCVREDCFCAKLYKENTQPVLLHKQYIVAIYAVYV